jgi:hypothetical protein
MPMRFPYLRAARVKLQERKNACMRCSYESAQRYVNFFLQFLRSDPVVRSVALPLFAIAEQKFSKPNELVDDHQRRLNLPHDPVDCAAFHLRCLEVLADPDENTHIPHFSMVFGNGSNHYQDMYDDFWAQTIVPLCSYIDERIDDSDLLLYLLARFQRECVWFESAALAAMVENADSRKHEETLDQHLRSWLFNQGIDYPFSTPRSPSGRADIVVWQGEEPLAIEVKVYDGVNRDLGHVSQGLWQAHRYASDYGKPFGYLVVFNVSDHLLSFEGGVAAEGPACIPVAGANVYAITIDLKEGRRSASKEKPMETKLVRTPSNPA